MMADDENQTIDTVDGLPLTEEISRFATSEMSACPTCGKPNPPNLPGCLYCGSELELERSYGENFQVRPSPVEAWERGFNVVHLSSDDTDTSDIVRSVMLDESLLTFAKRSEAKIPLARVSKANEAEAISQRLNDFGVRTTVVSDAELLDTKPPIRLRAIEFREQTVALSYFNFDTTVDIAFSDVRLFVIGSIYEQRSEATVKKKDRSPNRQNETMTSSDFGVMDLYTSKDGYRITTNGFDFSCLGGEKNFVAGQNLQHLAARFEKVFTSARFDREYRSLAKLINVVWPPTSTNSSKGLQRVGFKAQWSKGASVTNAEQFTKYSHLQALYK